MLARLGFDTVAAEGVVSGRNDDTVGDLEGLDQALPVEQQGEFDLVRRLVFHLEHFKLDFLRLLVTVDRIDAPALRGRSRSRESSCPRVATCGRSRRVVDDIGAVGETQRGEVILLQRLETRRRRCHPWLFGISKRRPYAASSPCSPSVLVC